MLPEQVNVVLDLGRATDPGKMGLCARELTTLPIGRADLGLGTMRNHNYHRFSMLLHPGMFNMGLT